LRANKIDVPIAELEIDLLVLLLLAWQLLPSLVLSPSKTAKVNK
jgi:hypothetical protein